MEEAGDGVEVEVEAGDDETHEVEKELLPRRLVTKTTLSYPCITYQSHINHSVSPIFLGIL